MSIKIRAETKAEGKNTTMINMAKSWFFEKS